VSDFRYRVIQYNPAIGARIGSPLRGIDVEAGAPLNDLSSFSGSLYGDSGPVRAPAEVGIEVSNDGGLTWIEPPNMRFAIIGDNDNVLTAQSPSITAVSMAWQLRKALVYATAGQPIDADGRRAWANITVGGLIRTLVLEAQSRGTVLSWLDVSTFTSTTDSAGATWTDTFNTSHEIGISLDAILNGLTDAGLCDWVLQGRSLRLYKVDTFLAPAPTGVVLSEGQDLSEGGNQRSLENLGSRNLIRGDGGIEVVVVDGAADKPWGDWEIYTTAPGSADTTSVTMLADLGSARSSNVQVQRTYTVYPNVTPTCPKPFFDYKVGSTIDVRAGGVLETGLRIRQLTVRGGAGEPTLVTMVVGDRFLERELRLARRIVGLSNGSSGAGSGGGAPTPPEDTLAPNPPTGFTSSTSAIQIGNQYFADITASWTAPTTNTNGTALTDLDRYEIQYARGSSPTQWQAGGSTTGTIIVINSLFINTQYVVRVRAIDKSGNVSAWLTSAAITTATDSTPPNQPKAPVVTPYFGQLRYYWDGTDTGSVAMPADFSYLEVHASTTSATFTPTNATKVDQLLGSGYGVLTDQPYATTVWFRYVAVDTSGNRSTPSTGVSAVTERVTGLDIEALTIATTNMADLAISTAKIADAAIINAKIANLAVDDAKIGNVNVGKLTAGTLAADITVSARIKTANTGARVELNSSGLQAFNTGGVQTVNVAAATGAVTITGKFQSGTTGQRIILDNSGFNPVIDFYPDTGANFSRISGSQGLDPTIATIYLSTGTFIKSATTLRNQINLFDGSFQMGTVRNSDASYWGGKIVMQDDLASMEWRRDSAGQAGGGMYADLNLAQMVYRNTDGSDRSSMKLFTNAAYLQVHDNVGLVLSRVRLTNVDALMNTTNSSGAQRGFFYATQTYASMGFDDGAGFRNELTVGQGDLLVARAGLPNFVASNPRDLFIQGAVLQGNAALDALAITYGATMVNGVTPVATLQLQGGGFPVWKIDAFTAATGFTLMRSTAGVFRILYHCIRNT
jgi:hypothetical protein